MQAEQALRVDRPIGSEGEEYEQRERMADALVRYLGPTIMRAFADDDVTEVYLNPHDGAVRIDSKTRGKIETDEHLSAHRIEMFLNAVAANTGATLTRDHPCLQAELPMTHFRGSRLQGFVPPVTSAPTFTIRKPPTAIYTKRMLLS